uniref:Uncharacterized protein n=1 Tax=viral metagenome TaxID=1070528 RepID=A0A6C0DXN2_9ZZZZ
MSANIRRTIKSMIRPHRPLTSSIDPLLENILQRMEEATVEWTNCGYTAQDIPADELPKDSNYEIVVNEIKKEMATSKRFGKKYSFVIGARTITIYAVYPYNGPNVNREAVAFMDASVKKMYVWLYVATPFFESPCSPSMTVYWYLSNHKKMVPAVKGKIIEEVHVNTAFTYPCPLTANCIYLFRKEEWFKVFIHECFHSFGLDFSHMRENRVDERIRKTFHISCDVRFSEAYTEVWAEILNIVFICVGEYSDHEPAIRISKLKRAIDMRLHDEVAYSMFQMCKVLKHNQMVYENFFRSNSYREGSNVFSYFVLKTIFIYHYNEFLEWCIKNNGDSFRIQKTDASINRLFQFIEARCRSPEFLTAVKRVERRFSTLAPADSIEMKTLRMSCNAFTDVA